MMSTYSAHTDSNNPLHLHSPKHFSQFDAHSAIKEIRKTLSRSPSKGSDVRQYSFRALSPCASAITFAPSPLSPSRRSTSDNSLTSTIAASPHATRAVQSHRPRLHTRRNAQTPGAFRSRTSPKSPTKRLLTDSCDSGNSSPLPLRKRSSTEADREMSLLQEQVRMDEDKENPTKGQREDSPPWKPTGPKSEKRRSTGAFIITTTPMSPMKRPDASSELGSIGFPSPSAKRRSTQGPALDFSIFESDAIQSGTLLENLCHDDNDWLRNSSALSSSRFSTLPRRSSSLRKSTLQQRQNDRPSALKITQLASMDGSWMETSPGSTKKGLRLSLDNHLSPPPRDSPFSSQGPLLNASVHPLPESQDSQTQLPRHPLSRTLTESSSVPSVDDDSPTHGPVHRPDAARVRDFSRSLPIGVARPLGSQLSDIESSQSSFATPGNYKAARPLPAAFMSTGLISKKNRNAEEPDAGLSKVHMPDTPCKKQSIVFPTNGKQFRRPQLAAKDFRRSLGAIANSTDVISATPKVSPFPFARNGSIFGLRSTHHNLARKHSFASIDGDDHNPSNSPSARAESQSTDAGFPPTPTKNIDDDTSQASPSSPSQYFRDAVPKHLAGPVPKPGRNSSKSISFSSPPSSEQDQDSPMTDTPSAGLVLRSGPRMMPGPNASFTLSRALKALNSPTPHPRKSLAVTTAYSPHVKHTKFVFRSPVSPRFIGFDRASPHTPQESYFPPDPSGLTISGRIERISHRPGSGHGIFVPATPTGPREYFPTFSNRPSLNLNAPEVADVDQSLSSRFQKIDLVGTGEFSQVYRVSQPPQVPLFRSIHAISSSRQSPKTLPDRVWAVKKSRHPYAGAKDRQRKIREVDVLKALGQSDHIVNFVDSWEEQEHLYIQTEFCEEGTLDVFLAQVGLKARLDDFRIWKILLEMALGIKHIHDAGYIHLDLKPANILITFEGVLKIGDFGMAARWPAQAGIDGEGDREYIGPEILMGKYDKPADVFALGLIMLETAGNVELPDNGVSWQKLRNGDMSDVPGLTFSTEASSVFRDASGNPLPEPPEEDGCFSDQDIDVVDSCYDDVSPTEVPSKISTLARTGELVHPPEFMVNRNHESALEKIVGWMISPDPAHRPVISQLFEVEGVQWAENRRRAGATVFEGNWGPADEILAEDAEMIDV